MKHVVLTALVLASIGTIANACGGGEHNKEAEMSGDEAKAFLVKAVNFAARKHSGHWQNISYFGVKSAHPIPFINAVARIAHLLSYTAGVMDTVTLATAYLHMVVRKNLITAKNKENRVLSSDEIEAMFKEIGKTFNQEVEDLVRNLTSLDTNLDGNYIFCKHVEMADKLAGKAKVVRLASMFYFYLSITEQYPNLEHVNLRRLWAASNRVLKKLRGTNPGLEQVFADYLAKYKGDKKAAESSLKC